jgi:hypothetical protein
VIAAAPTESPASKSARENGIVAANTGGVAAAIKDGGWGAIKGKVVFDGATPPKAVPLDVNKDQDHCLAKGPLLNEEWVVNPKDMGVRWVVVFLKPEAGKSLPVHESLKEPKGDAELDQPCCAFVPHVLAMRGDQKLLFKNPSPVTHTATLKGFVNDFNVTLPPKQNQAYPVQVEKNAIPVTCGIHPWMKGWAWVFEHPYFAVTDAEGNFEIKLAPAGAQKLVIWHEAIGYLGGRAGRDGKPIEVKTDGVTDVGTFKIKPTE